MDRVDQGVELGSAQHLLQLGQQQRADDQIEVAVGPLGREQRSDEDVAVQDDAWHSTTGGVLLLDGYPHRLFLAHARSGRSAFGQYGLNALSAAQHREIALVGQHDGLGTTMCTDHHGIGAGAARTETGEKRGQLCTCLPRRKHLIDTRTHTLSIAGGVHLWIHLWAGSQRLVFITDRRAGI